MRFTVEIMGYKFKCILDRNGQFSRDIRTKTGTPKQRFTSYPEFLVHLIQTRFYENPNKLRSWNTTLLVKQIPFAPVSQAGIPIPGEILTQAAPVPCILAGGNLTVSTASE